MNKKDINDTLTSLPTCDQLLDCAKQAAKEAGDHALRHSQRRKKIIQVSAHDIKLQLDRECQAVAEKVIHSRFPNHNILGEESAKKNTEHSGYVWIIDPIDGTVNFFHELPLWCSSVAIMLDGKTIAGAVYAPVLDECYTAHTEGPAYRNGTPINVSKTRNIEEAIVATGIDKTSRNIPSSMNILEQLTKTVRKTRILGTAALDICYVACGKLDGYYESGIYLWDAAASSLIVERAGGCSEFLTQEAGLRISFMASNGHLHKPLRQILVR